MASNASASGQPSDEPLLVELLTEELPPKALQDLGAAFAEGIRLTLEKHGLLTPGGTVVHFATPRRLAVRLSAVYSHAPQRAYTEKLMPAAIGLNAQGHATPALTKKLASKGLSHLSASDLVQESDGKQPYLYARGYTDGATLEDGLQAALDYAVTHLPIPKVMRYQLADGVTSVKFVRPAHGLIALWGTTVVDVAVLGMAAGRRTQGHRFMSSGPVDIRSAESYESQLLGEGMVVAGFEARRRLIDEQLHQRAATLNATLGEDTEVRALLDEVTALVEHPSVYVGEFEPRFLLVPPECLILTMRLNQKYFPLFEPGSGKLTHRFLIVSNMQVDDPDPIIRGNQRVVRPRLADAQFFFENDRKVRLADRVDALSGRLYHHKLGSQRERVERIRRIAVYLAKLLGADSANASRAALLSKADLGSNMVAEFPELQGIMGAYYAQADGEPADVALALRQQYQTRFEAPVDSGSLTSAILFLAERIETLIGIWSIGLMPTGERDPYGLRRAALGLISVFEQLRAGGYLDDGDKTLPTLKELLEFGASTFEPHPPGDVVREVSDFIYERYRNQLNTDFDHRVVDAVLSLEPPLHQVQARIRACALFALEPAAESLASANKRITNLLKKAPASIGSADRSRLVEPAERILAETTTHLKPIAQAQLTRGDFAGSLATMAQARDAVDAFFNDVMVMVDDPALRNNRLALLSDLHDVMNQVADISRLAQ